jgi:hypothetical protein
MQIVVQVHSLNLPYFSFFHKFLAFFYIQTFFYTIMNLFITLLENVNKSRTSANNVSLNLIDWTDHVTRFSICKQTVVKLVY